MPLTEDQKQDIQKNLAKFDEALLDKPMLATIYNGKWRQEFRNKLLAVDSCNDIASYPGAYSAPLFESLGRLQPDYQSRIEEGAVILLSKLSKKEENHLIRRLRDGCPSAEEELLLARGFSIEFGKDAIVKPESNQNQVRPEFIVRINNLELAIEAKGLLDSQQVQQLNQSARTLGQNYWISEDSSIGDPKRVRRALAKKILESARHSPCIIVLTLYSGFDFPVGFDLARQMALCPGDFRIPETQYPLAVALASDHRRILGVWFNSVVLERKSIDGLTKERLRSAVRQSFYACTDSVFFDENMSEDDHEKMLERVRGN